MKISPKSELQRGRTRRLNLESESTRHPRAANLSERRRHAPVVFLARFAGSDPKSDPCTRSKIRPEDRSSDPVRDPELFTLLMTSLTLLYWLEYSVRKRNILLSLVDFCQKFDHPFQTLPNLVFDKPGLVSKVLDHSGRKHAHHF